MTILQKGGNAPVPGASPMVRVSAAAGPGIDVDVSAFILRADGRVSGDRDMIFYGQKQSSEGAVKLTDGAAQAGAMVVDFAVDLVRLPVGVERIAFTATLDQGLARRQTFNDVGNLVVTVHDGGPAVVTFPVPTSGATEVALILAELYLRNGQWKLRAVGQGFMGGLRPLAESFGVVISDEPTPAPAPAPAPSPPPPAAAPRPASPRPAPSVVPSISPPAAAPVSLQKITLSKSRSSVDLSKRGGGYGEVKVNLNWNRGAPKSAGFFGIGKPKTVDLDLACLFALKDGTIGAVQALGNSFGDFNRAPYVMLQGDDRSGAAIDGEWMRINGGEWDRISRILVFAFIYEGAPNWAQTDATVTLYSPDQGPVEVPLDEGRNDMGMCAVALIENLNGQMRINRECQYFRGHREMDAHYRWGLRWSAGSKD